MLEALCVLTIAHVKYSHNINKYPEAHSLANNTAYQNNLISNIICSIIIPACVFFLSLCQ